MDSHKICDFGSLISIAPSQEYSLFRIFKDKYSEELNYPTLFYDHLRNERFKKLSYHEIARWNILHKSHDFTTNIQNIFFKAIKIYFLKPSIYVLIKLEILVGYKFEKVNC